MSFGTAKRMRWEGSGTGTGTRVSPRSNSLLFLLGEEQYRQPRAVYKYWARMKFFHFLRTWLSLRCWSCLRFTGLWIFLEDDFWYSVFSSPWFDIGYTLRQFMRLVGRISHISLGSTQSTPSTSCVCHPRVAGFGMDLADPVSSGSTLFFRVHSSSCGAQCGVVHSPFQWLDHRCHCNCRDLVLCGRHVLRECLRRDVVWWWFYSWWCLRFCLGQCEADDWKIQLLISSFKRSLGVYAC